MALFALPVNGYRRLHHASAELHPTNQSCVFYLRHQDVETNSIVDFRSVRIVLILVHLEVTV